MHLDVLRWIYAAQEVDAPLVKIGCTRHVPSRLTQLEAKFHTRLTLVAAVPVARCAFTVE